MDKVAFKIFHLKLKNHSKRLDKKVFGKVILFTKNQIQKSKINFAILF